jgi:tight adherence protein B
LWEAGEEKLQERLKNADGEAEKALFRRKQQLDWAGRLDESFDNMILRTGLDLKPNQAIAWMMLVGAVLGVAAWTYREEFWLAALGFTIGALIVLGSFFYYHSQYRHMLQDQLPDSIFLLARSLRAGMSFEQALEMLGTDGIQPLASEFKQAHGQIKLGLPVTVALENMAQRLQLIDVNALVSTVTIFQTTGGNLPVMLDRLAASARDRSNMRNYFRAATALARLSIIPIALAVPLILIVYLLWEPAYVEAFMDSPTGRFTLIGCILVEILGLYWIFRLLRFEY